MTDARHELADRIRQAAEDAARLELITRDGEPTKRGGYDTTWMFAQSDSATLLTIEAVWYPDNAAFTLTGPAVEQAAEAFWAERSLIRSRQDAGRGPLHCRILARYDDPDRVGLLLSTIPALIRAYRAGEPPGQGDSPTPDAARPAAGDSPATGGLNSYTFDVVTIATVKVRAESEEQGRGRINGLYSISTATTPGDLETAYGLDVSDRDYNVVSVAPRGRGYLVSAKGPDGADISTGDLEEFAEPIMVDDRAGLREELAEADRALAGDSNDAEHEALYGLTETLRGLLEASSPWQGPPPAQGPEVKPRHASRDATEAAAGHAQDDWQPAYSPWRPGGWYVQNVRFPGGDMGCVSRNHPDGKWRIERDPERTYPSRDAAARGERELARAQWERVVDLAAVLAPVGGQGTSENDRDDPCQVCGIEVSAERGVVVPAASPAMPGAVLDRSCAMAIGREQSDPGGAREAPEGYARHARPAPPAHGRPLDDPAAAGLVSHAAAEQRMSRAVNSGTDFVMEQLDLSERDEELLNITANAIGTAWGHDGRPFTWREFIAENWSAEPGTADDPATWRKFSSAGGHPDPDESTADSGDGPDGQLADPPWTDGRPPETGVAAHASAPTDAQGPAEEASRDVPQLTTETRPGLTSPALPSSVDFPAGVSRASTRSGRGTSAGSSPGAPPATRSARPS